MTELTQTYALLTQYAHGLKKMSIEVSEMSRSLMHIREAKEPTYQYLVNLGDPAPSPSQQTQTHKTEVRELKHQIYKGESRIKELEKELSRITALRTDTLANTKKAFSIGYEAGTRLLNFESTWHRFLMDSKRQ